ncbi:hypothetical protein VTK73DRAFT_6094 [Phialemonium thermophilum]|uniref:Uncharacterized protein n=1 Tax=Phialemonium thermophilum TaxID=223376 RepID=A0ABR3V027_9PEZI
MTAERDVPWPDGLQTGQARRPDSLALDAVMGLAFPETKLCFVLAAGRAAFSRR